MANIAIDKVRASRDGHQYHEAWLARRALGLLLPRDSLCGIAVEGLSVEDQKGASQDTIEIADATFYFGSAPNFQDATRIEIAQFKYSIARQTVKFLASDAVKTLGKFAKSEAAALSKPDQANVLNKISYAIYTNRPVGSDLVNAISALAEGTVPSKKNIRAQYDQIVAVIPLKGDQRQAFAAKVSIIGGGGDLNAIEKGNARVIADWSASNDALARARLGDLRQLVRDKAGHSGQKNNVIVNIDVLAALEIAHESDLLPTPQAFAEPGPIVQREQLQVFLDGLKGSGLWLVHAAGGVGKTVFVQSMASRLGAIDEVVVFDCFGGGAYRSPLDGRHRPERGLMHIVNELACRGLCDPILPGASDPTEVVRRAIQRFEQAIEVLRRAQPEARLAIVVDAADNAAMEAKDRAQSSFPQMLLESLSHMSPIDGLVCIATARSERRAMAIGRSQCNDFELRAFSFSESRSFIEERRPDATLAQMEAIHRRSNGNPRVMANLIEPDRSLVALDSITADIDLNDLIRQRIEKAISLADEKGSTRQEIAAFLCALSVLPPPVPIDEIAAAFGINVSEVESFAADLSPLLERTRHGLIFRDEPTETLVRQTYGQQLSLLDGVVARLSKAQVSSVYAARSLPSLLFAMGRADLLRTLAFDTRFPPELDSDLAKRAIRLNRLRTAVGAAAKDRDFNATVDLLVELSSLVIVDERGEDYLLEEPDLVVGLGDPEALRRLFEVRTGWPGTRHARLAIAYLADGDAAEAYGHAVRADDWHRWHSNRDDESNGAGGPDFDDHASIAFYLFAKGRSANAARYIAQWKPYYGFLVASRLFEHCVATDVFGNLPKLAETVNKAVSLAKGPPALIAAAFTAFPGFASPARAKVLLKKLATKIKPGDHFPEEYAGNSHRDTYRKAMLRCAMRMASLGMVQEADRTLQVVAPQRYGMWLLREAWHIDLLIPFALSVATRCANESRTAEFFDCLPKELWALIEDVPRPATDKAQQKLLRERLKELEKSKAEASIEIEERRKKSTLSSSDRYHASEKISDRVMPLLALVRLLTSIIAAPKKTEAHSATLAFLDAWEAAQSYASRRGAYVQREGLRFTDALYKGCAIEMFAALDLAIPNSGRRLFSCVERCEVVAPESVIRFVKRFAATRSCHSEAGKFAVLAVRLIEREDDVQRRSQLFASLSRALLQANRSESALIFKRGLRELDAIGSGDYEFANELLHFAATLRDGKLKPELALRLAKICEINVYDSHKWHWSLTARALTSASGAAYLAQIARWHDRDKVDLGLTLPSALTYLVENNVLSSAIGVSLLRLVDPQVLMNWGWHDFVKAMIGRNATEPMLHEVLDQYEHSFPGRSSRHYLNELGQALGTNPKMAAKFAERIKLFTQRGEAPRKVETESRSSASALGDRNNIRKQDTERQATLTKALADVDPTDAASFESFVEKMEALAGWPYNKSDAYKALRDRVPYGDRTKHIEVIVAARNLELFQKNDLLQAFKDEWAQDSPSQLVALSGFGSRLVRQHAEELLNRKWGFGSDLFKLSELTTSPIEELAIALVEVATTRELNAAAMTWLSVATILSKRADASVPRIALERLLDSGAARLADPIGDGPWRDELDAGTDPDNIAAGLVWFRLGSPIAKERWRAAHAVRSIARYEQWAVIERMFDLFDSPDAGAFQDRSLPFFGYHAQLWFLLAVARIALDSPKEIARFRPRLEAIAFDDIFPHAGLREAACKALQHCLAGKRDTDAKKLISRIAKINVSKFPVVKTRNSGKRDFPGERPKDVPEPEPRFFFDYDFEKQDIDNLARVFGLPKWRISDLCYEWVHKWAPGVTSMNDFSGRERPSGQRGYYRPTDDAYQSHGTYLAWHALAVVGGQLLLERPITDESYYDDPWQNWLSGYRISRADGYWISDGTSGYPLVALNDLRSGTGSDTERDLPIDDKRFLATLAGLGEPVPKDLIVQASWSSPDSVNFSVMSALVPPADAELSALAVATSPSFHMWLPFYETYDEEEDSRFRRDCMEPCDPWITHAQQSESLDRYDPLGAPSAISIYRPSTLIAAKLKLSATKPWSHAWVDKSGSVALRYEGWGGWQGEGESENRHGGHALYCDRSFLAQMLKELDRDLLLLVKLQRYHERKERGDGVSEESKFTHSFMVAIIDKQLGARIIEPTPAQINAVATLGQYGVHEFSKRLRVLREPGAAKESLRPRKPRKEAN